MIDHLEGKRLVVCINNQRNEASLEQWKIYQALPDEEAEKHGEIHIIDEEREDYLSPSSCFPSVFLESSVARTFILQSTAGKPTK
jgi:hypothetical protein